MSLFVDNIIASWEITACTITRDFREMDDT